MTKWIIKSKLTKQWKKLTLKIIIRKTTTTSKQILTKLKIKNTWWFLKALVVSLVVIIVNKTLTLTFTFRLTNSSYKPKRALKATEIGN